MSGPEHPDDTTDGGDALVVLMTAPDAEVAAHIARTVVEEKLAACVNIVPGLRSIYVWQERLCDDNEVLCVIKTRRPRWPSLRARLVALHPYDVPEVLALPLAGGHRPYLDWISASTADS